MRRLFTKCMLRPEDVAPRSADVEVIGAFNPGAVQVGDEVVLLVRVAERPSEQREGFTGLPRWDAESDIAIDWSPNETLDFLDPRVVVVRETGLYRLTFLSYLLIARSKDGRRIDSFEKQHFLPCCEMEEYGVEDPRITPIGDSFYITYVAVSRHGVATALASTQDFKSFTRHGTIFAPENKDVILFPERIQDRYVCFHRPNPHSWFCNPEMWLGYSDDLIHWGGLTPFFAGDSAWETGRIGGGPPPIRTDRGWLEMYHGNDKRPQTSAVGAYAAGLLMLDLENPGRVLGRTKEPVMVPETDYEVHGFVPNVVFPTGIVDRGDLCQIYYGAADAFTGVVELSKSEMIDACF